MRRIEQCAPAVFVLVLACAEQPSTAANSPRQPRQERGQATPSQLVAPRLVAPLTGYGVSSHKPTFHVEQAPGSDGVEIEVCRDRNCAETVAKFSGSGNRVRSNVVLPEGRLFYRARSRRGGRPEGPSSVAFQFAVRRGAPDVDTAFVSFNDANADGRDDELMFGAKQSFVFRVPEAETGPAYTRVGDVNGDGFSDVLASPACPGDLNCSDTVVLHLGGAEGFARGHEIQRPSAEPADPDAGPEFADAGDVDGDGYADVVEFFANGGTYFYRGGRDGLTLPPLNLGENRGRVATLGGDTNGDGYADIVIAHDAGAPPYQVRVYLGGPGGPSPGRTLGLRAPDDAAEFGASVAARCDVNADGFSDVVIGASSAPYSAGRPKTQTVPGQVYVFYGAPRPSPDPGAVLRGTEADGAYFGLGVGVGDLDGNGAADVVGIAPCVQRSKTGACSSGQAFVFRGSAAGIATVPTGMLSDPTTPSSQVVLIRDIEGDGFDDMSYAGSFYPGSPNGVDVVGATGVR